AGIMAVTGGITVSSSAVVDACPPLMDPFGPVAVPPAMWQQSISGSDACQGEVCGKAGLTESDACPMLGAVWFPICERRRTYLMRPAAPTAAPAPPQRSPASTP